MSEAQALTIPTARPVTLTPDQITQQRQYVADADRLFALAQAIEAEGQPVGPHVQWEIGDGPFRVICKLDTVTRHLLVTVQAGGQSVTVLRDDSPDDFTYNNPPAARWLDFLLTQHELAQLRREVLAAQKIAAERATEIKRQSLI